MSKEENSADAQGVKTYKVNEAAIKSLGLTRLCDLCEEMGVDPACQTPKGAEIVGVTECDRPYSVCFDSLKITIRISGFEYGYGKDSDAFALAVTYGIYEEA